MELVELSKEGMLKVVQGDIEHLAEEHDYSDKFYQLLCLEYELRSLYRRGGNMDKSLKKKYELGHSYDFADYDSPEGRRFTKKNSHRRVRRILGKAARNLLSQFYHDKVKGDANND